MLAPVIEVSTYELAAQHSEFTLLTLISRTNFC